MRYFHVLARSRVGAAAAAAILAGVLGGLGGCSRSGELDGGVVDNFGRPLPGVTVTVENATEKVTTDKDGRYKITFPYGDFVLTFTKDGYNPQRYQLDLGEKPTLSAEDIVLGKLPADGLSLVGTEDFMPFGRCQIREVNNPAMKTTTWLVESGAPTGLALAGLGPQRFTFVDFHNWDIEGSRQGPKLFKLRNRFEVQRIEPMGLGTTTILDTPPTVDTAPMAPGIGRFFTATLGDGAYVYTGRTQVSGSGNVAPNVRAPCFIFVVGKRGSEWAATEIPAAELAAFRAQVQRCWPLPASGKPMQQVVTIEVGLKEDGTLDLEPRVMQTPRDTAGDGGYFTAAANDAAQALKACQPYKTFSAAKFPTWKLFAYTFDLGDMFGR